MNIIAVCKKSFCLLENSPAILVRLSDGRPLLQEGAVSEANGGVIPEAKYKAVKYFFHTISISMLSTFLLLSGSSIFAQSGDTYKGVGFGGPSLVYTTLAGEGAVEVGGLGGGFIGEQFYIGGGGFGLTQQNDNFEYTMGYGGLMLGYLWQGRDRMALHIYAFAGFGGIEETGESLQNEDDFWVFRPAAEIDFQLTDGLRLGIGGGYRQVIGANGTTLDDSDVSAPFGSITLRFGSWGRSL
jgi:hypothetical protein